MAAPMVPERREAPTALECGEASAVVTSPAAVPAAMTSIPTHNDPLPFLLILRTAYATQR